MAKWLVLAAVLAVASGSHAWAATTLAYGPAPAWVKPLPIPKPPQPLDPPPRQILLWDMQTRYGADADETYVEIASRINTAQGLSQSGNLIQAWNPETETLTLHRLTLLRGGQTIDILASSEKPLVVRRETNLESAMLDGQLTATLQINDIRVGDIVDYAFSVSRKDPVLQGRSEGVGLTSHQGVASHLYVRQIWPTSKPMQWRVSDDLPKPRISQGPDGTELVYDLIDAPSTPKPPNGAPLRFWVLGLVQASQFADWAEVSALAAPLYAKAAGLSPTSPLRAEAAAIRAAHADPQGRAMAALRLVQDQVRYVFIGMNSGGYVPADADLTWSRRFGDCKGKTALLLALLHELGIEAQPALVNTVAGDGMDARLPMFDVFDHVLVRAILGGRVYWLDGTRIGDRRLSDLPIPAYHWALPVQPTGAQLIRLMPTDPMEPQDDTLLNIDLSAGPEASAIVHAERTLRGDVAAGWSQAYAAQAKADQEQSLRRYWSSAYNWVKPERVSFRYDDEARVFRIEMDGTGEPDWGKGDTYRDYQIDDISLGWNANFRRDAGLHADAPYTVDYPNFKTAKVTIKLPPNRGAFSLMNAGDVKQTTASVAYARTAKIEDGMVEVATSTHSVTAEFPASEADAAQHALFDLSEHDVLLRYTLGSGATAANPEPPGPAPSEAAPTDAAGWASHGADHLHHKAYTEAAADFSRAMTLEPRQGKYVYDRGVARFEAGQVDLALQDFDAAIKLDPKDALPIMARAQIHLQSGRFERAAEDFDAALSVSSDRRKLSLRIGDAYEKAGRYAQAVDAYSRWLKDAPSETPALERSNLLNKRCWARAEGDFDLEAALADCDASLKLSASGAAFDSRALVQLRLGKFDAAIADYDAAMASSSTPAPSLYGRGLAKQRKGLKADGAADIAAAIKIAPGVEDDFRRRGLKAD